MYYVSSIFPWTLAPKVELKVLLEGCTSLFLLLPFHSSPPWSKSRCFQTSAVRSLSLYQPSLFGQVARRTVHNERSFLIDLLKTRNYWSCMLPEPLRETELQCCPVILEEKKQKRKKSTYLQLWFNFDGLLQRERNFDPEEPAITGRQRLMSNSWHAWPEAYHLPMGHLQCWTANCTVKAIAVEDTDSRPGFT